MNLSIRIKRLEDGTYAMPLAESIEERRREITAQDLGALLRVEST
jgi:hypothetical protein